MAKPLIALISDELSTFQKSIAHPLDDYLRQAGYGLICVCGGALKPYTSAISLVGPTTRNAIYEVARNYDVAGFIVLTSIIGNHASATELAEFTQKFSHKPVVSFGVNLPDIASVSVDNYAAMSTLMRHMTRHEYRQNFAFIRGFPDNPISLSREQAFRDVLTERELKVREELIIDGNFKAADSFYAMDSLLQRTTAIDAVVAANDTMALSAVHALRKHGIRIPEDVIVSGFDNTIEAEQSIPAITTIDVRLQDHVKATVASLLIQIKFRNTTKPRVENYVCDAQLIVRGSSAPAPAVEIVNSNREVALFDATSFSENFKHNMNRVQSPAGVSTDGIVEDVVGILVNGSRHSNERLENALSLLHDNPSDVVWWRHLHYQMGKNVQEQGHVGVAPDALTLITSIMSTIQTTIWSVEAFERVLETRYQELVLQLRRQLSETASYKDVETILRINGELFKLRMAFLCLYENFGELPAEQARLIFQHPNGSLAFPKNIRFSSGDILPAEFLQSGLENYLILEPLCIGSTHLGYLVMDERTGNFPGRLNPKALADNISNALYRVL